MLGVLKGFIDPGFKDTVINSGRFAPKTFFWDLVGRWFL